MGIGILFFCLSALAQISFPYLGVITAQRVKVRAGPNQNFEELCKLGTGEEIVVVEKSYDWCKVKLPVGASSFIHANYVEYLWDDVGQVKGDRVNIRAGKDVKYSIIGQAFKGQLVKIVERTLDWYKIEPIDQSYGWTACEFVSFKSKEIPPAKIVQMPTKNIYARKRMQEQAQAKQEPAALSQEPEYPPMVISALGTLEPAGENLNLEETNFRLVVQNQTAYFLKGPANIFEPFLHKQVKVDGEIKPEETAQVSHPVLLVKKIDLLL